MSDSQFKLAQLLDYAHAAPKEKYKYKAVFKAGAYS
jgi:hypothetical protein